MWHKRIISSNYYRLWKWWQAFAFPVRNFLLKTMWYLTLEILKTTGNSCTSDSIEKTSGFWWALGGLLSLKPVHHHTKKWFNTWDDCLYKILIECLMGSRKGFWIKSLIEFLMIVCIGFLYRVFYGPWAGYLYLNFFGPGRVICIYKFSIEFLMIVCIRFL